MSHEKHDKKEKKDKEEVDPIVTTQDADSDPPPIDGDPTHPKP